MGLFLRRLTVGPIAENVYLLGDDATRECVVVDPGAEGPRVLAEAERAGMRIRYILNTHGHVDHIGAVAAVREATLAPYGLHPADLFLIQDTSRSALRAMIEDFQDPPKPDLLLGDGETLRVGGVSITVTATPGHTPGGVSFLVPGLALVGDTLFRGSIGRFDLPGGDGEQLLESIRSRLLALPDETRVYPGHGPETTIGQEREHNPFLRPGVRLKL